MFIFNKQPWEETTRAVDFAGLAELQVGEIIDSAEIIVYLSGVVQQDIFVSRIIEGSRVIFRVRGGIDGNVYKITVRIITNNGHKRESDVFMFVREV